MSDTKQNQDEDTAKQPQANKDKAGDNAPIDLNAAKAKAAEATITQEPIDQAGDKPKSQDGAGEAEDAPIIEDPMAILQAENLEVKDKILRLTADMENLRRRTEREKQDIAKYAISNFARDILAIDDNFQRTLQAVPTEKLGEDAALKPLIEGVEMTARELVNVFERHGITKVEPMGEIFDPNRHQALFEVENASLPAGTILEVVAPGYTIGARILRPAMVGLAKGGEKPAKADTASENTPSGEQSSEDGDGKKPENSVKVDKSA